MSLLIAEKKATKLLMTLFSQNRQKYTKQTSFKNYNNQC